MNLDSDYKEQFLSFSYILHIARFIILLYIYTYQYLSFFDGLSLKPERFLDMINIDIKELKD